MQNFLQDKHVITEIILATYVLPVKDGGAHKNRPSHGLAINLSGEKTYSFNDGKSCTVAVNEMIYLPKFLSKVLTCFFKSGCNLQGAISAKGFKTKNRLSALLCGIAKFCVFKIKLP